MMYLLQGNKIIYLQEFEDGYVGNTWSVMGPSNVRIYNDMWETVSQNMKTLIYVELKQKRGGILWELVLLSHTQF